MIENIKEQNKNLINLRTSLINIIIILTGGILGLGYAEKLNIILIIIGIYFDLMFLMNVLTINKKINDNIRKL